MFKHRSFPPSSSQCFINRLRRFVCLHKRLPRFINLFLWRNQHALVLGAFANLRKATIGFVTSAHVTIRLLLEGFYLNFVLAVSADISRDI